jgi:hypothetical protein
MACDSLSVCNNPSHDKQHASIKRKAMIYLLPAQVVRLLNSNLQMSTLPSFHDVVRRNPTRCVIIVISMITSSSSSSYCIILSI